MGLRVKRTWDKCASSDLGNPEKAGDPVPTIRAASQAATQDVGTLYRRSGLSPLAMKDAGFGVLAEYYREPSPGFADKTENRFPRQCMAKVARIISS
jgi:hypothetical protein